MSHSPESEAKPVPDICTRCGERRPMVQVVAPDGTAIHCAVCGSRQDFVWHESPDGIFETSNP